MMYILLLQLALMSCYHYQGAGKRPQPTMAFYVVASLGPMAAALPARMAGSALKQ